MPGLEAAWLIYTKPPPAAILSLWFRSVTVVLWLKRKLIFLVYAPVPVEDNCFLLTYHSFTNSRTQWHPVLNVLGFIVVVLLNGWRMTWLYQNCIWKAFVLYLALALLKETGQREGRTTPLSLYCHVSVFLFLTHIATLAVALSVSYLLLTAFGTLSLRWINTKLDKATHKLTRPCWITLNALHSPFSFSPSCQIFSLSQRVKEYYPDTQSPACSDRPANIPSRFLAYHSNLLDPRLNRQAPVEEQTLVYA